MRFFPQSPSAEPAPAEPALLQNSFHYEASFTCDLLLDLTNPSPGARYPLEDVPLQGDWCCTIGTDQDGDTEFAFYWGRLPLGALGHTVRVTAELVAVVGMMEYRMCSDSWPEAALPWTEENGVVDGVSMYLTGIDVAAAVAKSENAFDPEVHRLYRLRVTLKQSAEPAMSTAKAELARMRGASL